MLIEFGKAEKLIAQPKELIKRVMKMSEDKGSNDEHNPDDDSLDRIIEKKEKRKKKEEKEK